MQTYNPSNFGNYVDFDSEEYDIGGESYIL